MKKIITALSIIFLFVFVFIPKSKAKTSHPLDEIQSFDIYVRPYDDGTMDFSYKIDWLVLDSSSEGVTWVKIGIPNRYCSNIRIDSGEIRKAYYYASEGGTYIRCDLYREFIQGEHIHINFTFHQSHLFTFMDDSETGTELTTFSYIPGWFDEIEVKSLKIHWLKTNVWYKNEELTVIEGNKKISNPSYTFSEEDEDYYVWETSLLQGQKAQVDVSYETGVFPNINRKETYVGPKDNREQYVFLTVIAIIILIVVIVYTIAVRLGRRSYYCTRGFFPVGRYLFYRSFYYGVGREGTRKPSPFTSPSSGGYHGGGGHSCACACACACAGGGRAGCSKKDFYKGKIDIDKFIEL